MIRLLSDQPLKRFWYIPALRDIERRLRLGEDVDPSWSTSAAIMLTLVNYFRLLLLPLLTLTLAIAFWRCHFDPINAWSYLKLWVIDLASWRSPVLWATIVPQVVIFPVYRAALEQIRRKALRYCRRCQRCGYALPDGPVSLCSECGTADRE